MSEKPYALGIGLGTHNNLGEWLEVYFPAPRLHPEAKLAETLLDGPGGSL